MKIDNHLFKLVGSISSKRVSGHFSSLHSFQWLVQDLKFSKAHLFEFSVFLGTQTFERESSSSLLSFEKRLFFAGGSLSEGWSWLSGVEEAFEGGAEVALIGRMDLGGTCV